MVADTSDVSLSYDSAPWRCAPCGPGRWQASPTPLIVLIVIGVTYIPMVLFTLDYSRDAGRIVAVILFHVMLALMLLSYLMTMCTDPGTPPEEWQRQMTVVTSRGESVPVCRRSGLYKPPRSHFDSVTERLTLNMDHFCPWVVNTVGFYNRKFFMLFLVYANLTLLVAVISLGSQVYEMWDWLNDKEQSGRRWFPGIVNVVFYIAAIVIDAVLLITLIPFAHFHLRMASLNETTIEGSSHPKYNVGTMQNLRSVFGHAVWAWPIPLYLYGPDGDGLHWPSTDDRPAVRASAAAVAPSGTSTRTSPEMLSGLTAVASVSADSAAIVSTATVSTVETA